MVGDRENMLVPLGNIPGGFLVYYADGDEEILSANRYTLDLFECETFEEFMELTGGTFKGFVHGPNVWSTEDSIWGQVSTRNGFDHIYYQICTKTGRTISVDDYGLLVRRENERPVFYVFIAELDRGSVIDWLTGLPGMERFLYMAGIESAAMAERGERRGILVFDFMGMKAYNAANGREAGDWLLKTFAGILRDHFGNEMCCRFSGDSFCAITPIRGMVDRVNAVFADLASACGKGDSLPVMAGVCEIADGDEMAEVVDRARLACDSDRVTWESHLSWFTLGMRRETLLRSNVLEHVDLALAEGWVRPYYQPIVRATTGRYCALEALARWHDPRFGNLMPHQFIPALEEAGLLRRLDLYMVRCVAADIADRRAHGLPVLPVSVNLSVRDLIGMSIASDISAIVDSYGVARNMINVEFTESSAKRDPLLLSSQVSALHEAGFGVWMDDFGSGLSTLNSVKEFDFDLIKLEMGLAARGNRSKRVVIVDSVMRAAKRIGAITLAEGVETAEIQRELTELGCDLLQGYFYARPMPLDELEPIVFGDESRYESLSECYYWNAVGLVSLADLGTDTSGNEVADHFGRLMPTGVIELRDNAWHLLRSTETLRALLVRRNKIPAGVDPVSLIAHPIEFDGALEAAVERSEESGTWELVAGPLEYGSGYQFRVKPLARCGGVHAYTVASTPTTLGAALGTYGDVPMGYAVLRLLWGPDGRAVDAEYVYANALYCLWGNFNEASIVGARLSQLVPEEAPYWLEVCERATRFGESTQELAYGAHAGHWISYSVTPSLTEDHCIFAFALADAEHLERQELYDAGTHDPLTGLLNRRGIDDEIERRVVANPFGRFVLVLLDVDDFKTINDLYGHNVGDEALRTLARGLTEAFPQTAVVGRNGGDEALAALFGSDAYDVDACLDRLINGQITYEAGGRTHNLSLSAGYAWSEEDGDLKETYTKADEALYAVKLAGKCGYRGWEPGMQEVPQRSLLGFTARELAEGMPLAMLAHREDGSILFANEGLASLLGYDRLADALEDVGHSLKGVIHPDDWDGFMRSLSDWVAGDESGKALEMQARANACGGRILRVVYRAQLVTTKKKGDIVYAYLVASDTIDRLAHMAHDEEG